MRRALLTTALISIALSTPVTLLFVGGALIEVYERFGLALCLVCCGSVFLSWLGIAALISEKEEVLKSLRGVQ
jgi:threonine/homoserine/homoserine lactone efflux protein